MIGPYILVFILSVLFLGCVREACNERERGWLRWSGHFLGALILVLLLALSKSL